MKKVRCPHCAVVNLEGFITYPHCAGCGARLPEPPAPAVSGWRRPVGPLLWTSVVGCAVAVAALVAARFFEAAPADEGRMAVYGRGAQSARVGQPFTVSINMSALRTDPRREDEPLRDIKVRLPREVFKAFTLSSVRPRPDTVQTLGSARYFFFRSLPSISTLRLSLRARRPGRHELQATIYADNETQDTYRVKIHVDPAVGNTVGKNEKGKR